MTNQEKNKALTTASRRFIASFLALFFMAMVVAFAEIIARHNNRLLVLDRDEWECSDSEPDGCAEWRRRSAVYVLPQSAQR